MLCVKSVDIPLATRLSMKSNCLATGLIGWQSALSFEVSDALPTVLEKPKDRFIRTPDQTHDRTRSPRLAASGPQSQSR